MTLLIIIVLFAFGMIFYSGRKRKYANEPDPLRRKGMLRRSFWIGFAPLILWLLYLLGWVVYAVTHMSGDL